MASRRPVRMITLLSISMAILAGVPMPAAGIIAPTGRLPSAPTSFRGYDALVTELSDLERTNPSILTIYSIGRSWETAQGLANRTLIAAEVHTSGASKRDILIMGLHHGNEWISMEVAQYLLRYLLLNAGNDSRVDAILARANVWFVPVVNPDGLEYSRLTDVNWRKNRHDNGDGTFGVDINRNYGYMWGSSNFGTATSDIEYRGQSPFSEPETQAIQDLALAHPPIFSLSFHSAGGWILYPWSYTTLGSPDEDRLSTMAVRLSEANGYKVLQEGRAAHVNPGNSDDWLYGTFGTASYTFEVGADFNSQNASRIASVVRNNVEPALRGAEMALGLRDWQFDASRIPVVAGIGIGATAVASSVFFVIRWRRIRRDAETGQAK